MKNQPPRKHSPPAILMRWRQDTNPLPTCTIKPAPGAAPSTSARQPFDFCGHVRRLLTDIALRCPQFKHIHVPGILLSVTQARSGGRHGLQARVTPLRFAHGGLTRQGRGVTFHIQRYFLDEQEFLYVMTFCLPRFLNQSFDQKLITLFHELFHIHPNFNGDLRRYEGRYHFHTHSQRAYDEDMVHFARSYLANNADRSLSDFLRMNFAQLQAQHGSITGIVVPRPKIIPLLGVHAAAGNITALPEET